MAGMLLGGSYLAVSCLAKMRRESKRIDDDNPYLNRETGRSKRRPGCYEAYVKPALDKGLSFAGLIVLSPVYAVISAAIYLDDPGPVLFTQKRVGKGGHFIQIHKFRTMKMDTPHDVPTHLLKDPDQYVTRVGRILRKMSLDELPQIWDIFRGVMSIIGPRPALWNQEDLIAEREKYGANDILPGLTGLAQISGRDELEIAVKAEYDGKYTSVLHAGGIRAVAQDLSCFFGTIRSVIRHDGVVEGGTGNVLPAADPADAGFEDYGYKKTFHIDKNAKKKVLITGAGSYVGESFRTYAAEHYPNLSVDVLDMQDERWREYDFSPYDSIFHVAGIAHADVGKVPEAEKQRYYAVNADLAIETAALAKESGVRQFILMSSMIIYGDSAPFGTEKIIDEHTVPAPANFYGDSKWQADKGVRKLQNDGFQVAVIRAPMIYGKGSKGNYPVLSKMAKRLPVFPNVRNQRSVLYIENLCEFVSLLVMSGESGVYFPQNGEYSCTSGLVREIGKAAGRNIRLAGWMKPAVVLGSKMPGKIGGMVNKAFGNYEYAKELSDYEGVNYRVSDFRQSVRYTEAASKSRILFLVNHDVVIYNFRLELVERLLEEGYEVHISSPYGERIDDLIALGAKYHEIEIDRHGMNPVKELSVLLNYKRLIHEIRPAVVLGYTIKPNIYGAMAAGSAGVPFVANITGLGTAVENGGLKQKIMVALYKLAFVKVQCVFFQNEENEAFFRENHIAIGKHDMLPGSGVNLERFPYTPLPECGNGRDGAPVKFAFISRIMKEKGIEQYLSAAEIIRKYYPTVEFHVCGFCECEYEGRLEELNKNETIIYHGMIRDVAEMISSVHCIVHPTYYPEGISNVLLEACSCGRPIVTTDRSGCREVVSDGVNGYQIAEKNVNDLVDALKRFLELSHLEKNEMGLAGRKLVEKKYDRKLVIDRYMEEIHKAESATSGDRFRCVESTVL